MNITLRKRISPLRNVMCRREQKIEIVLYIICNLLLSKLTVDIDLLNAVDGFTIFLNEMIDELDYLAISLFIYIYLFLADFVFFALANPCINNLGISSTSSNFALSVMSPNPN